MNGIVVCGNRLIEEDIRGVLPKELFQDIYCGGYGSPNCEAFTENIVRGEADCLFFLEWYM